MYWYAAGKGWERIESSGLAQKSIRYFRAYVKNSGIANIETRFLAVMDDNSMYWFAPNSPWKSVTSEGLPANYVVTGVGTYQKRGLMSTATETRYVITLADGSLWWYGGGKKWQKVDAEGLPANANFKDFTAYMKISGDIYITGYGTFDGRLIGVLSDESIWWFATNGKTWKKLETTGLPKGYKVRSLSVFEKQPGLLGETMAIVVLDDNSVWRYMEGKNWTKFNTTGLPGKP
jgi:hypothetical protein